MKGVYIAFFRLEDDREIEVGALGRIKFEAGTYVYTGSGRKSVEKRLNRHFSSDLNRFWHIDYFSREAEPIDYFILPETSEYECFMSGKLEEWCHPVDSFGSSDCDCDSHLFRLPESF